jgi:phosphoribosylformimino-5-aminoimidazole carboxamide ribotide isomerase
MSRFGIIPVLDLKLGTVVRARAGDRANYHPIVSPLARSSAPLDILHGLLALAPFPVIYVADLDAITGAGNHRDVLAELAGAAPQIEIWVDGGFATADAARAMLRPRLLPVFGSESLAALEDLAAARDALGTSGFILSLDYRRGEFLGAPEIEHRVDLWPDRIILMTLDRVGSDGGPDLAALQGLAQRAGRRAVFAAGGVRNAQDLDKLKEAGIAGALVASALHDGRLPAADIARFMA